MMGITTIIDERVGWTDDICKFMIPHTLLF